jgi:PAS domain S-box-containing protein
MAIKLESIEASPSPGRLINSPSPARYLAILAGLIFLAELFAMAVLYFIQSPNYLIESLLDGMIMLALILPGLYFLQLRPLLKQVEERTRADQALRASEELLRRVLELLPVGVWITDRHGKIIHGNPACQSIWGGARYVGIDYYGEYKGWWLDSGERIEAEQWASARAIRNGETILNEEVKIESFDGTQKIILNSAIPIYQEGEIRGAVIVNQDVTQRIQYEQELMHSNQLIESAFNSIDTSIAYMDREFTFVRVNETYARSAGHPVEFFIGKNHFDLYPHEENQAIFQRVVDTGEPFSVSEKPFEYAEYPERGVTYWNWSLQPVKTADGVVQGVVLSLLDVTERKLAQIQLARQNQELLVLSNAERRQRELAEGLVQSIVALNSSLDLDYVLNMILEQLRRSVPFTMAGITLIENGSVRVVRYTGLDYHPETAKAIEFDYPLTDYSLLSRIVSTQQSIYIEDINESQDWPSVSGLEWVRSYVAAPLIIAGQVNGIINLTSDQPGAFSQETVSRLMAFAAPAALALHNAQLYKAELTARQLAETLSAASLALTQTLNFETVINTLLQFVCRLLPYERAYIAISENESRLKVRAIAGRDPKLDLTQAINISIDAWDIPNLQEVYATQKSLLIPDIQKYPSWTMFLEDENIRSWLGVPMVVGGKVIGILVMTKNEPDQYSSEHVRLAEGIVLQASVAIQNAWLFEQVRSGHERLQSLSRRLVEVQESERRYIARELHDETSQALTAVKFGLRLLEQEVDQPQNLLQRVADLKQLTDKILEELHHLAMDLRPAGLDHLGLVAVLDQLVKSAQDRYQLDIRFKTKGYSGEERLPDYLETSLYRIVQEALTNAVRHASAQSVAVILELLDGKAIVIVEDDGIGFDTAVIRKRGHLGLLGMQERAQSMGGTLLVESRPGGGTTVVVEVPYDDPHLDRR